MANVKVPTGSSDFGVWPRTVTVAARPWISAAEWLIRTNLTTGFCLVSEVKRTPETSTNCWYGLAFPPGAVAGVATAAAGDELPPVCTSE